MKTIISIDILIMLAAYYCNTLYKQSLASYKRHQEINSFVNVYSRFNMIDSLIWLIISQMKDLSSFLTFDYSVLDHISICIVKMLLYRTVNANLELNLLMKPVVLRRKDKLVFFLLLVTKLENVELISNP